MTERDRPLPASFSNTTSGEAKYVLQAANVIGGVHLYRKSASSSPAPHQLPPDVTHFTGRIEELGKLDNILKSAVVDQPSAVVVSAIAASAGVGKTSLAVHWAHRVHQYFPDGELYVNLRGYDPGQPVTPEQALEGFLLALDVSQAKILHAELATLVGLYRSLLAERRMLILLDNAVSPEQVRPLLPGSPKCVVVVTSRSRLSGLIARDGAERIPLDMLSRKEAITLIQRIVGSDRVDREPEATAELARLCAYLPLALRIAAERVAAHPYRLVSDLVADLQSSALEALAADEDEQAAVRSVFSWSYRALSTDVARAFRLLGLSPGLDIDLYAAAALTNTPTATIRRQLDTLTGIHLIAEVGRNRYRFHDLLRAYAIEQASIDELQEARHDAVRRILLWYLHTAAAANRVLHANGEDVPLGEPDSGVAPLVFTSRADTRQWLEQESNNLIAIVYYVVNDGHHAMTWQFPAVLTDLLWRQKWAETISIYQRALAAARNLRDLTGELFMLYGLGDIHLDLERFDDAVGYFAHMLTISQEVKERRFEGTALGGFGQVCLRRHRSREAIEYLTRAADIFAEVEDRVAQANMLANLGDALRGIDQFDEAVERCRLSLAINRESNSRAREAVALRILGWIYLDLRRFDEAIDQFQAALVIDRDFDNRTDEARTLHSLGDAFHRAGRVAEAREAWQSALLIFDELGSPQVVEVRAKLAGPRPLRAPGGLNIPY